MTRGHFADIDTESEPLNDEQRAKLRAEIELFYKSFVERVACGRDIANTRILIRWRRGACGQAPKRNKTDSWMSSAESIGRSNW